MNQADNRPMHTYINHSKEFKTTRKMAVLSEIIEEIIEGTSVSMNKEEVLKEVAKRESLSTTGFGNGFAIPHGKSSDITEPVVGVMKSVTPIEWEAIDSQPVTVIFLLVVPMESGDASHLKLLSKLSYHLMDKDIQTQLKMAESDRQIQHVINQIMTSS